MALWDGKEEVTSDTLSFQLAFLPLRSSGYLLRVFVFFALRLLLLSEGGEGEEAPRAADVSKKKEKNNKEGLSLLLLLLPLFVHMGETGGERTTRTKSISH